MKPRLLITLTGLLAYVHLLSAQMRSPEPVKGRIRHDEKGMEIAGTPEVVFAVIDDIANAGMHLSGNNARMLGGKLTLEWISGHHTGLGAKCRWRGKTLGMKMDFTVEVLKWEQARKKNWSTVGRSRIIVVDWFEMYLRLAPGKDGVTLATLGIYYTKSRNLQGLLLGRSNSRWCVKSMLNDTRDHFRQPAAQKEPAKT